MVYFYPCLTSGYYFSAYGYPVWNNSISSNFNYLPKTFSNRLTIQTCDLSHARDASMPQLLSLKSSEQPALVGVHQAHDQVDLLVEGFIWMLEGASTYRADTMVGMKSCFHHIFLELKQYHFDFYASLLRPLCFISGSPDARDQPPGHLPRVDTVVIDDLLFPADAQEQAEQEYVEQNDIPGGQVADQCTKQGNQFTQVHRVADEAIGTGLDQAPVCRGDPE